jgi:hypothetical protein
MRTLPVAFVFAIAIAASGAEPAAPAPTGSPNAASPAKAPLLLVLPLRAEAGLASSAHALDDLLLEALHRQGKYEVMGQADLNALLGIEKLKDASGCDDVGCAAELGGALGAPFLLSGQLATLGSQVVLSLRLLDTKTPKVVGRGSARGANDADSLTAMLTQALSSAVGVVPAGPAPAAAASAPSNPYEAYSLAVAALGRRVSNNEFTALLRDLDGYEGRSITVPAGQDFAELLTFYRAMACFRLLRSDCLTAAAGLYQERWPAGAYASSLQSMVTQVEDAAFQRVAKKKELQAKIAEIEKQRQEKAGSPSFNPVDSLKLEGFTYFGALAYDDAARVFAKWLEVAKDDEAWFEAAQALIMTYERAGRFDEARALLLLAQARDATAFRLRNMHQTLQLLQK